ncbi:MAG: prolyl oligopeptidase family serine peptidase [Saprospiraceae bacterium]|nr:prolyl oligopeptidase family serine peptidase [Saprospiraceae bacterium]MCC6414245.1 prolyl oligopeptidase family serine peptidase [Saprospiraceae bacterium]
MGRICILCFCFLLFPMAFSQAQQSPMVNPVPYSIDELQRRTFNWFWELADTTNFQIPDRYPTLSFSSIAATGFGLSSYLVGVERGWITRKQAADRVLKTLQVLKDLPQGPQAQGVSGYKGFYYHFLDNQKAHRYQKVELSSIDTGLLMAGILSCMSYFDGNDATEKAIRETSDFLYRRVEWDWFMNDRYLLSMGWHPEKGFLSAEWRGYNEAMVLLVMAMGSPTHPVPKKMWDQWCNTYYRTEYKGQDMVNFGPLFGHQYSHVWIDFRGIQDDYMRGMGIDYFENSRRATLANRQHCIDNPGGFTGYGPNIWGLTAGDGPGYAEKKFNGRTVRFNGYAARGVAADYHDDDGTIAPTAVGGSVPFAPEVCLPALEAMWNRFPVGLYGFYDGYNESYTWKDEGAKGQDGFPYWVDVDYLGIDQGPILLMLENHRSELLWNIMKKNPYIVQGLKKAGFTGGWLDKSKAITAESPAYGKSAVTNPDIPLDPAGYFQRLEYKDASGKKLPYQMLKPESPKKGVKYPLVLFLHGAGERGDNNHAQTKNGVYAFCETVNLEKYPCYLIAPQCPIGQQWGGLQRGLESVTFDPSTPSEPGRLALELLDKVLQENPDIDRNRIYITGLSMGGFGTIDLLMRRPELFAAAMPLCGGGDIQYTDKIKNIPIWLFHGGIDEVVLPAFSRNMYKALKDKGSSVKYTEFSTLGHSMWQETYYNPAVLDWLFSQHR